MAVLEEGASNTEAANREKSSGADLANSSEVPDRVTKDEFVEDRYGWVVVAAVFLINAHTWGMNQAFGVFLAYYLSSNYFPNATPIEFAFVGGLSVSMAFVVAPLATICTRKFGTRTTLITGLIFETAAFVSASFTSQIWHLILSQGVTFGIGMGFLFTGSVSLIPQWFQKRRSFANSVGAAGSGFGGLIYSLGTNAMIQNLGLPWAFRVLAILSLVANGAASLMAKDRNKKIGAVQAAFRLELFRRGEFWLYLGWAWFSSMGYTIVTFSLADYCQTVGFTATQGSIVAAMFNLSQFIGRPIVGFFSDRVGRMNVAGMSALTASVTAYLIWTLAGKSYPGIIIYALFGIFAGHLWALVGALAVEVVGLQLLPSAMSITWVILVLPATFSEAMALGLEKPGVNGYLDAQMFTATMFMIGFVFMWCLRIWKIRNPDKKGWSPDQKAANVTRPSFLQACFSITNI